MPTTIQKASFDEDSNGRRRSTFVEYRNGTTRRESYYYVLKAVSAFRSLEKYQAEQGYNKQRNVL